MLSTAKPTRREVCILKKEHYVDLETAHQDLQNAFQTAMASAENKLYLIKGQTALGKTSTYLNYMKDSVRPVVIAVPTHELKRQIFYDANLHGILDENIFFAAKLADYIGANRPIFGMTMFEGAGADVVRAVNGVTVSYSVDEIKNYLYLIAYENYTVEIDQDGMNQFNATEVAEKFDAMVEKLDR